MENSASQEIEQGSGIDYEMRIEADSAPKLGVGRDFIVGHNCGEEQNWGCGQERNHCSFL